MSGIRTVLMGRRLCDQLVREPPRSTRRLSDYPIGENLSPTLKRAKVTMRRRRLDQSPRDIPVRSKPLRKSSLKHPLQRNNALFKCCECVKNRATTIQRFQFRYDEDSFQHVFERIRRSSEEIMDPFSPIEPKDLIRLAGVKSEREWILVEVKAVAPDIGSQLPPRAELRSKGHVPSDADAFHDCGMIEGRFTRMFPLRIWTHDDRGHAEPERVVLRRRWFETSRGWNMVKESAILIKENDKSAVWPTLTMR